jgi:two-component system, OmpR family, sensor histidine kinase KdpD
MDAPQPRVFAPSWTAHAFGATVWATGWLAMVWLDGRFDLPNLALLFILTSVLCALWWPAWLSIGATLVAALAFNWTFVPPRGTLTVDQPQHVALLLSMVGVSAIVAALMGRLRRQSAALHAAVARAEQLRHWGETLRDAADPLVHLDALRESLALLTQRPVAALALRGALPPQPKDDDAVLSGTVDADRHAGLWHCLRQGEAMGPGTHRHREQQAWYLPMQGRGACRGAVVIGEVYDDDAALRLHAQALCNQMGAALQRVQTAREAAEARERAQTQEVRNTLLASIAHDHRTPLATIVGAASSLLEQSSRLHVEQRRRLAQTVVDEASRLSRMTDNTLQLARLDAPNVQLRCDWESAEELVGSAVQRARQRAPERAVRARLEPGIPLLWCDAILLTQLLDNLLDNALKYSPDGAPVEVLVRKLDDRVVLAVRDRGPGIAPRWAERVFDAFQRGAEVVDAAVATQVAQERPGVGVGLALCQAVARVHGGELRLRARAHGGCSFECGLPLKTAPPQPNETVP